MNIFQLSKYARTGDPDSLEENLLTAIFCWVIERDPTILEEVLRRCRGVIERDGRNVLGSEFPRTLSGEDPEIDFQLPLRSGTKYRIADFGIDDGSMMLIGESKADYDSIDLKQIRDEHMLGTSMFEEREVYVLVVTPDSIDVATKALGDIPAGIRERFFWISWEEIWKACNSPDVAEAFGKNVRREMKEGIELAGLKPFRGFEDSTLEMIRGIRKLDQIGEFFTWVGNIYTDPGGLNLESDRKLRHSSSECRAYAEEVYMLFWERTWKNKGRLSASYGIDLKLVSKPVVGAWLLFPQGDSVKSFRMISSRCAPIARDLKNRFSEPGMDAGLWEGSESDFYVRLPLNHEIAEDSERLRKFLIEVISYLRSNVVPGLEDLGWEF